MWECMRECAHGPPSVCTCVSLSVHLHLCVSLCRCECARRACSRAYVCLLFLSEGAYVSESIFTRRTLLSPRPVFPSSLISCYEREILNTVTQNSLERHGHEPLSVHLSVCMCVCVCVCGVCMCLCVFLVNVHILEWMMPGSSIGYKSLGACRHSVSES